MSYTKIVGGRVFLIGYFGGFEEWKLFDGQRKFVYSWNMLD